MPYNNDDVERQLTRLTNRLIDDLYDPTLDDVVGALQDAFDLGVRATESNLQ